jgi:autophagy-related protein 2
VTRNLLTDFFLIKREQMVTWHPLHRISDNGEIASDESDVELKILPLRCIIDQRAVAFARAFFQSDDSQNSPADILPPHLHAVPPPLLTMFRVRAFKLKVDYRPQKLDTRALRNGAVVELINLSPLDGMVLTLKDVEVENQEGFGAVVAFLARRWVQDICSTQLLKFVTKSRPLEPITEVSGAAVDMVVLPWDAFRNGESIQKALKAGAKSLSKTLVYEFFSLSSRAAECFAGNVSRASSSNHQGISGTDLLPSRPLATPRHMLDAGPHAVESLSRGFQAANYKIVIVPYREYHRTGATGAVRSVLKGIPVAIAAPASGAAEALSFALLGARNQIRPDIRKEEEASMRGLHLE